MIQNKPAVEDNGILEEQMLEEERQTSSSSKKLKSFQSKDEKAVEHTMQHGNESADEQQDAAMDSEFSLVHGQSETFSYNIGLQLNETSLLVIEACAGTPFVFSFERCWFRSVAYRFWGTEKHIAFAHYKFGLEEATFVGFLGKNCDVTTFVSFSWCATLWHGVKS